MPAAPETGKVGGKKRGLEVFGQIQPQQQAHSPRHFRVTGEVKIQLERVKNCCQDQHRPAVAAVVGEHLIHHQAQHIADGHHFKQAQRQQPQAAHRAGGVKAMLLLELRQQVPGAADGALGDGGEKVEIKHTIDEVGLDLAIAAGSVDQVADGREAVKADAQRHGHGLPAVLGGKSAVIFKESQNYQQADHAHPQRRCFVPLHRPAAGVGTRGNGDSDRQHGGHGLGVKVPAGRQQKRILPALRQVQVHRSHNQQKAEKANALQAHTAHLPRIVIVTSYYTQFRGRVQALLSVLYYNYRQGRTVYARGPMQAALTTSGKGAML